MDVRKVSTREGYDLWSSTYDRGDNPLVLLEEPIARELLGEVSGLDLLDVGCGTGRHSVALAQAGARVTGMDFSEGMLERARAKSQGLAQPPRFVSGDLQKPFPFESATFDRVLCSLVFDHISEVQHVFSEMGRVCRPGGKIVVTTMHPAVMLLGRQANFTDPGTGQEIQPESVSNQVSDLVMGALGAGLQIVEMREYPGTEALVALSPKAQKFLNWPLLLTLLLSRG